jgi:hypothetical protein
MAGWNRIAAKANVRRGDRRSNQEANLPLENISQSAAAELLNVSPRLVARCDCGKAGEYATWWCCLSL